MTKTTWTTPELGAQGSPGSQALRDRVQRRSSYDMQDPQNLYRSPPSFRLNTNLSTYRVKPHKTRKHKFQEAEITGGRTVAGERAVDRLSFQELEGK